MPEKLQRWNLFQEPLYSADAKVPFCSKTQLWQSGAVIKFSYSITLCSAYFKQGFLSKYLAPNYICSRGFSVWTKAGSEAGEAPLQFWADLRVSSADGSCLTCSHSATWQSHGSQNNRLLSTKSSMCSPSGKCIMLLGLGHAQMSRKLLVFLCGRIGHLQPSLGCGADAQLDTDQPITDPSSMGGFVIPISLYQ